MQNDIAQSSLDFLIQDVCVNDLDQQIAGDPATCAKHRDLKFKEFIPYIRPNNILSVSNQTRADFPVQGNDGNYLVASPYDRGGAFSGYAFGDWDVNASDGGELIETKGEFSSYISTKDTSGSQEWVNQSCVADDPWGLFPMKMVKGENGNKIFQLSDDKCKTIKPKPTFWSYEKDPFTYTSGKKLYSIIVTHYEDEISKNPNIEVHYFTREYGLTRWESWQDSPNQDQSNTQNCSGPNKQTFNGHLKYRLPNNIHISIPSVEGESMLLMLDKENIEVSTGSACGAFDLKPSHVLLAIHQNEEIIHGSIRFSLGKYTNKKELDYVLKVFPPIVEKLKNLSAIRK
jgi:hypothetical protein